MHDSQGEAARGSEQHWCLKGCHRTPPSNVSGTTSNDLMLALAALNLRLTDCEAKMRCSVQTCVHLNPELPCFCGRAIRKETTRTMTRTIAVPTSTQICSCHFLKRLFCGMLFFTTVLTHFNQTTDYMLSHKLLLQHRLTPQHRIHHPHPHPHHRRQSSPPSSFRSPYCSQVVFCCKYIFTMYILMHLLLLSKLYNRIYLFTCVHACRTLCMPMCIFRCVPRCVLYCVINPRCFGYIQLEILHIIMYNDIIHCDMLRCAVDCYGCTLAAASLVCH